MPIFGNGLIKVHLIGSMVSFLQIEKECSITPPYPHRLAPFLLFSLYNPYNPLSYLFQSYTTYWRGADLPKGYRGTNRTNSDATYIKKKNPSKIKRLSTQKGIFSTTDKIQPVFFVCFFKSKAPENGFWTARLRFGNENHKKIKELNLYP